MTDFRFHKAAVKLPDTDTRGVIRVDGDCPAEVEVDPLGKPDLSWQSPFNSLSEAAAFLKYRPMALCPDGAGGVRAIRINRDESSWRAKPTCVRYAQWEFFKEARTEGMEVCYAVEPIEYDWSRTVQLVPAEVSTPRSEAAFATPSSYV